MQNAENFVLSYNILHLECNVYVIISYQNRYVLYSLDINMINQYDIFLCIYTIRNLSLTANIYSNLLKSNIRCSIKARSIEQFYIAIILAQGSLDIALFSILPWFMVSHWYFQMHLFFLLAIFFFTFYQTRIWSFRVFVSIEDHEPETFLEEMEVSETAHLVTDASLAVNTINSVFIKISTYINI